MYQAKMQVLFLFLMRSSLITQVFRPDVSFEII